MGLIFREGTPVKNKVILISFFAYLGLTFYGMYANFLVDESIYEKLLLLSFLISAIIIGFALYLLFSPKYASYYPPRPEGKQRVFMAFCFFLFIPFFSVCAIAKGAPAGMHHLFAQKAQIKVTVKRNTTSKMCGHGVKVKEYSLFLNEEVCNLKTNDWYELKENDDLLLIGKKSVLGFSYVQYES
ncbi:hypothetical protein [Alteromonas sp. S015]|uniref:hypothetical protein n=1 Tax=Alteromonas sp. S015 TaxID=3117401 RepID=UPI002FE1D485